MVTRKFLCSYKRFQRPLKYVLLVCLLIVITFKDSIAQSAGVLYGNVADVDRPYDKCTEALSVLNHYIKLNETDSIVHYALAPFRICDINDEDDRSGVLFLFDNLIRYEKYELDTDLIDSIALEITDPGILLEYFTEISECYLISNDEEKSELYWAKAQEALPYATDDDSRVLYYNLYGFRNFSKGNTFSAFQSFKLAASFDKAGIKNQIVTMNELGNMYTSIGENEKAIEIFKTVVGSAIRSNDLDLLRFAYFGLMNAYGNEKDYEKLIETAYRCMDHQLDENIEYLLGYTYCMLGDGYLATSELDSAKHYYLKGIEISKINNEFKELKDNYYSLGKYYRTIGDNATARSYFNKAIGIETYFSYPHIYRDLSDLWKDEGDYTAAYNSLHQYVESTNNQEKANLTDVKLAAKIIEDSYVYRQEAEAKIIDTQRDQERLLLIIVAGVIALVLVSSFLYLMNKNGKRLKELNDKILLRNKDLDRAMSKQKDTIRYLENFASVAAHDLKAPIRTASSFAGLLAKTTSQKLSEKELSFLNYIDSSVSKLSQMIDDLLSLSKLDVDLPAAEAIDLNELLDRVQKQLSKLISDTNCEIRLEADLPIVMGHSTLLIQLFQNIIKNSITHNKTAARAIIRVDYKRIDDNWVVLRIADNAGGIPKALLPSLFDLFESSDKNSGNGIGLATCKKIVQHYGGDIWVDVEEDIGSTFNFTLPTEAKLDVTFD